MGLGLVKDTSELRDLCAYGRTYARTYVRTTGGGGGGGGWRREGRHRKEREGGRDEEEEDGGGKRDRGRREKIGRKGYKYNTYVHTVHRQAEDIRMLCYVRIHILYVCVCVTGDWPYMYGMWQ